MRRLVVAAALWGATACDVAHVETEQVFFFPGRTVPADAGPGAGPLEVVAHLSAVTWVRSGAPDEVYRASMRYCSEHTVATADLEPRTRDGGGRLVLRMQGRPGVFLGFGGERSRVDLQLSPRLPQELLFDLGEGESVLDLTELPVRSLRVLAGAGDARVVFGAPNREMAEEVTIEGAIGDISVDRLGNANTGRALVRGGVGTVEIDLTGDWRRDAGVTVEATVGDVILRLPRHGPGVRLEVGNPWRKGLSVPGFERRGDVFYSEGFETASPRLEVSIEAGIGKLYLDPA